MSENGTQGNLATLSIKSTDASGVDPLGTEAVVLITSITDQRVQLHFSSIEALADFAVTVKAAIFQMRKNAREAGNELVTATPVSTFNVGHVQGLNATLLAVDPDTPAETMLAFSHQMACDVGQMLVMEGGKRLRIQQAIKAGTGTQVMTPRRRVLRPGEH